jgi:aminoglycoside phosphotransferase (APT) family kinase protein
MGDGTMIGEWTECLLSRAEEWGLPRSGRWESLLYNNYHPHMTTMNLLWFHEGGRNPDVVTKVYRQAEVPKREFDNLTRAHACAPQCAPEPLHFGRRGPFWELWMRGVPGERVSGVRVCSSAALRSIVNMVAELHEALAKASGAPGEDRYQRAVVAPLDAVANFGESASAREGCRRLAAATSGEWIQALPVIPQHGDLYLGNLLSDGEQWRVVDWESFGTVDLPFYDLGTLLLSALCETGKMSAEWDAALVRQAPALVRSYCDRLNLPIDGVRLLLPLMLVNWFHLQLSDGRTEFATRMYRTIVNYFENTAAWEGVFAPR